MNRLPTTPILFFFVLGCCVGWGITNPEQETSVASKTFLPRYDGIEQTHQALRTRSVHKGKAPAPVSVLVGHHLLAAELFADTLARVPAKSIRHVILIAPNHFLVGRGRVQTMDQDFSTPYGRLAVNHELVRALRESGVVTVEPETFVGEHGIANILPYIKKLFPLADVTPIVVWPELAQEKLEAVRDQLNTLQPADTLLIGSFDFSHYVTSKVAEQQDRTTRLALEKLELASMREVAVDGPEGLWLFMALTKDRGAQQFRLDHATNSGIMTDAPASAEVTSYFTGRFFR